MIISHMSKEMVLCSGIFLRLALEISTILSNPKMIVVD